jgi:copper homeostasis protein
MTFEVCVDSVESALAAQRGGAQRVELCSDLLEGGVTPSAGLITQVRRGLSIPLFVLIRPRGGDFCYANDEITTMREDIRIARDLGADGVVLGVLDRDAQVDIDRTADLIATAQPLPATFHRAIDMTPNPLQALEAAISAGAARVLTSGGAPSAEEGAETIAAMVRSAGGRIGVVAGGGVAPENIAQLAGLTHAREFHASLRTAVPGPMRYRRSNMHMGEAREREYLRYGVREEDVRAVVKTLGEIENARNMHERNQPGVSR